MTLKKRMSLDSPKYRREEEGDAAGLLNDSLEGDRSWAAWGFRSVPWKGLLQRRYPQIKDLAIILTETGTNRLE